MTDHPTTEELNEISVREIVEEQESLERISDFVAEGARYVCHVRTTSVPTIYRILGNFYSGLYSMRDAMEYLNTDMARADNLYHTNGGDPGESVEEAMKYLIESRYHLFEAAKKMEAAQQALAWVGHNDPAPAATSTGPTA
jgi:hypothetical protein